MAEAHVSQTAFWTPRPQRKGDAGVFARMDHLGGLSGRAFLARYADGALLLDKRVPNPDETQLRHFRQVLGSPAVPDRAEIVRQLTRWLPALPEKSRVRCADALDALLKEQRLLGPSPAMLANLYVKLMCWLYYQTGALLQKLEGSIVPRVLFLGVPGGHEMLFLRLLNRLGADVLLLLPDPAIQSDLLPLLEMPEGAFPADFSVRDLIRPLRDKAAPPLNRAQVPGASPGKASAKEAFRTGAPAKSVPSFPAPGTPAVRSASPKAASAKGGSPSVPPKDVPGALQARPVFSRRTPETYFEPPLRRPCTNAWLKKAEPQQVLEPLPDRGSDPSLYYNAFLRVEGAEDKTTYQSCLMAFAAALQRTGRRFSVVNGSFGTPDPDEIRKIRRHPYRTVDELIIDQAMNLPLGLPGELERELQAAFVHILREASREETSLPRLTSAAVLLHCKLRPVLKDLFPVWKETDLPCLIHMGACRDPNDALLLRLLACLPVDVVIFAPNLDLPCLLRDPLLLDIRYAKSLPDMAFPLGDGPLQVRTVASHAEEELNGMLYNGAGLYRPRQFAKADTVILQSTADEIRLLWEQELRFRTGFSSENGHVTLPVFFAKLSGVPDRLESYWQEIKSLSSAEQTFFIRSLPCLAPGEGASMMALAKKALRGGKLDRSALRGDRAYPYAFLREEVQEHLLDKLQLLLERRLIRGIGVNGAEYKATAVALSLRKEILRALQGFDFTKKNPKMLVYAPGDAAPSPEDAILLTLMNLCGFDVVLFVPTGYQTVERYLDGISPVEHQLGAYRYDLALPDLDAVGSPGGVLSLLGNLFKRGK